MEMVEKSGENIVVVVQHGEGRRGNRDYLKNYRRYLLVWISSSCQARRSICASCQKPRLNKEVTKQWVEQGTKSSAHDFLDV